MRFTLRRSIVTFAIVPLASLGVACGSLDPASDVAIEEQGAGSQALIEGGDTIEDAPGGAAGEDIIDDDAALDEAGADGECRMGSLRARVAQRYDVDGDGALSESERAELRADVEDHPRARRALERHRHVRRAVGKRVKVVYDADRSGALDDAERALLKDDLQARCIARQAQLLERYDVDGDGALSDGERAQVRADREARIAERRATLLARFDADGSGRLEESERDALRADVRARMEAKRAELKAIFDVDDNGTLDDDEAAAMREHLRERIRLELEPDEETAI
jgi:hypothetical protein